LRLWSNNRWNLGDIWRLVSWVSPQCTGRGCLGRTGRSQRRALGAPQIQILNMLTVTAGVLLMLLVITPDGYRKAGWAELGLHRAAGATGRWPCSLRPPCWSRRTPLRLWSVWCPGSSNRTPRSTSPSTLSSSRSSPSSRRSAGVVTCCRSWPAATRTWHRRLSASCTAYGTCR
jgi:hypothetical protein